MPASDPGGVLAGLDDHDVFPRGAEARARGAAHRDRGGYRA
jgi:hypothetical protein